MARIGDPQREIKLPDRDRDPVPEQEPAPVEEPDSLRTGEVPHLTGRKSRI
jgi:hypothetical protein